MRYIDKEIMTYELWSGVSGNLVGAFPTEDAAIEALRKAAIRNGSEYVESLALIAEDDSGESHLIAEGHQLTRRLGVSAQPA
jgi:hypothetical protein